MKNNKIKKQLVSTRVTLIVCFAEYPVVQSVFSLPAGAYEVVKSANKQDKSNRCVRRGDKYHCAICDRMFTSSVVCLSHYESHLGNTICPICQKDVKYKHHMYQHMARHSGKTTCHLCHKNLSSTQWLQAHLLKLHGVSSKGDADNN